MNAAYLSEKFATAHSYEKYVLTGTPEQQHRWKHVYDVAEPTANQQLLVAGFVRRMNILVVSGIWCGDCVQQCPLLARIAEANTTKIDLRFVDRDAHRDLADQIRINAGDRVPMAIFMAEDFEPCCIFGDRTLNRYRALARAKLGPSCPTGIAAPDQDEMSATLHDWLNEFERTQLMLRLSARLRAKHGD